MMDKYIEILANVSKTKNHELIEECLNYYDVCGLNNLTEKQIADFCRMKGLVK